ncbi:MULTISPECIES: glucan biosynthesis protein G [Halopseudomonas]|uniref:Glucans biosynthesis protein G n=1 Tax=Halopseudomonas bauzanensis TaxID=653930 RepID=A0A4U0YPF0_9GAMM|nr:MULTISPECIES: glucan biosynthesis protein G [Halopseudomonas]TKA92096.1 glucan biosynthesis protein G [Halopseudomonas bauzanensis]WGK62348.1 glucan biosynthesis protein G [Halopseudomonas sp. SMJS2]
MTIGLKRLMCSIWLVIPLTAGAEEFQFQTVIDKAESLADSAWKAPPQVPRFLQELSYHDYQSIRFKPESSLWREEKLPFNLMLIPPGLFYHHAVRINLIEGGEAQPLAFDKTQFSYPNSEVEKLMPADLGFAGFKLTFPFDAPDIQNQFLVFAGASYYRAVGRHNNFGLSGRGIAVNTGLPSGEEFPSFIEFWLEKPAADAETLTFYGLLDGKSLTGAYRFTVTPGDETALQVESVLFPRQAIELAGVAPLTSMFYYGQNTLRPDGEWRPEVHDSDGLLIHDGASDEWLWRPLNNPATLTMDYFGTHNVRGFGLFQRDADFGSYMDPEAGYDTRPSAWIEPQGDWGKGHVVLTQLPTPDETNDNIVAFWTPDGGLSAEGPHRFDYIARFGMADLVDSPMAQAVDSFLGDGTRIGGGDVEGAVRVVVDFAGGPLSDYPTEAPVAADATALEDGELIEQFVEYVPALERWRLSMLVKPAPDRPLSVRAFLREGDQTLSETWTYQLAPGSDVLNVIK